MILLSSYAIGFELQQNQFQDFSMDGWNENLVSFLDFVTLQNLKRQLLLNSPFSPLMFIGPSEGTIDIQGPNDSQPVPVIPLAHHRTEHGRGEFPIANQHHPLH
jgi:hypothetical protein